MENPAVAAKEVLAEVAGILEPAGLQEEAELPAKIMEEFIRVCTKVGPPCFRKLGASLGIAWDSGRQWGRTKWKTLASSTGR